MAARRRKRGSQGDSTPDRGVHGAPLEPIRHVERELTRPDGTRLKVQVPVYPPFQLESRPSPKAPARPRPEPKRKQQKRSDAS